MISERDIYVHERGICESSFVGAGTHVWAFAHVLPGATIGMNCNICDGVFIENDVIVGDNVTVKCGVQLWDGVRLGNGVFIGPNATFTNDKFPRSKQYQQKVRRTVVECDASIGANATLLSGIRIGRSAMVGAGAVVTKDVPPYAVVVGNPAHVIGYVTNDDQLADQNKRPPPYSTVEIPVFCDHRGNLTVIEFQKQVPFIVSRAFTISDVPNNHIRGEHAHRECHQFVTLLSGRVNLVVDDGATRSDILLTKSTTGIYLPPLRWTSLYKFSSSAVVQVFASLPYDRNDYIFEYEEFRELSKNKLL